MNTLGSEQTGVLQKLGRAVRIPDDVSHGCAGRGPALLAHIHIPKTAGTSVWRLLQQCGGHRNLYVNDTHFVYDPPNLAEVIADSGVRSVSSHSIRTFPPYVAGRRMLYFTILRDPVQQFISYMTFIKKVFRFQRDPNLLACLPPDPPSLDLREFARWLLTQNRDEVPFHENYTVNFLAQHTYVALVGAHGLFDPAAYRTARLAIALVSLDQFMFVGLSERMDESIAELRTLSNHFGIEIPPGEVGRENVSSEFRDDLSWIHPGDEVGRLLLDSIQEDRQLYEWAVKRFEERHWTRRFETATDAHSCAATPVSSGAALSGASEG
jgi:hypothetical protein